MADRLTAKTETPGTGNSPDGPVNKALKPRRFVPVWVAAVLGGAVVVLLVLLLALNGSGSAPARDPSPALDSGPKQPESGQETTRLPALREIDFDKCDKPPDSDLPRGTKLVGAAALATDEAVLLVVKMDAPPLSTEAPRGGDWQMAVALQLWEPVGDHFESVYEFNVGGLNFGGLVGSKRRDGGLVDPGQIDYFVDGRYMGVVVNRDALSVLDGLDGVRFVAEGLPSIYVENSRMLGFEERDAQWCPDADNTLDVHGFN